VLETVFGSVLSADIAGNIGAVLLCLLVSLGLGVLIALLHGFRSRCSRSFVVTLALLPAVVQMVILLVNGNLGAGVAVMGAFGLVRFRSVPGSAREIGSLFLAMAVGLATGMGYLGFAVLFAAVIGGMTLLLDLTRFGEFRETERELRITVPEGMDYEGVFDDVLARYTSRYSLDEVRSTHMGSLFRLSYHIHLRDTAKLKPMLDELRERNGNLEISCGRFSAGTEAL